MELEGLQTTHTDTKTGFFSSINEPHGSPAEGEARQFFEEQHRMKKEPDVIIHDREHPQPPPHHYIPGAPGPLHYGVAMSDGYDAGVFAVSCALFGGSGAFRNIPIQFKPVFRRRRRGDCLSEWCNAFVTRVDPCECISPEETYTPYEVARYRDQQGRMRTTLDFNA